MSQAEVFDPTVYLNGEWGPLSEARIPVLDRRGNLVRVDRSSVGVAVPLKAPDECHAVGRVHQADQRAPGRCAVHRLALARVRGEAQHVIGLHHGQVENFEAVTLGEDERAGRWSGSAKTECGLHTK